MYTCRECEQPINQASEICPYCGADLTVQPGDDLLAPPQRRSSLRVAVMWGVALVVLAALAWFALPWRMAGSKPEAESQAQDALAAVQAAVGTYQSSEGGFPPSLEALGASARGAAQKAQSVHYTLQYSAGKPDGDGRLKSYTLVARPGNYGYLSFYTDESGVVRATHEDRPATAQDPPLKSAP